MSRLRKERSSTTAWQTGLIRPSAALPGRQPGTILIDIRAAHDYFFFISAAIWSGESFCSSGRPRVCCSIFLPINWLSASALLGGNDALERAALGLNRSGIPESARF
jgi:hypothetical protein